MIDYSKGLPRAAAAVGLGAINYALIIIHFKNLVETQEKSSTNAIGISEDVDSLLTLAAALVISYTLGTLAIFIGDVMFSIGEKEKDRVLREVHVFETGNQLLIERYQDCILRSSIVLGFLVTFILNGVLFNILPNGETSPAIDAMNSGGWRYWVGFIVINLVFLGLAKAARQPIEAIDEVLKEHYPHIARNVEPT